MKKSITKISLICFLFLSINTKSQTGVYVPQLQNFDTAMIGLLNQYGVPGGQLAITYYGRLVYNRGFGYADTASHTLVCPDNVFRLASVSKQITSVTIMHLYEQGRVHLDDTVFGVNGILNDTIYQNVLDPRVFDITVRELLTHSGGWNRTISGDPMFDAYNIAVAMSVTPPANSVTVIKFVLQYDTLDFIPGTQYQYSNLGYAILGRVIEKITGQNYETYVRDSVLQWMNITDMHSGFNLLINSLPNEVHYYDYPGAPYAYSVYDNTTMVPWPYGGFNIEAMDANGAWVASAEDLCKFLVSVDGFNTKPDFLLPATIDTMVKPSLNNVNYALGWQVNSYNNWWHTGSLPGTSTEQVRASNQLNWAILLNTRPSNSTPLVTAADQLVWNVLPTINSWPFFDLFDSTYICSGTFVNAIEESSSSIIVYPNPANTSLTIHQTNSQLSILNSQLIITDILGNEVYSQPINNHQSSIINISNWSNGVYFYQIRNDRETMRGKFIKE